MSDVADITLVVLAVSAACIVLAGWLFLRQIRRADRIRLARAGLGSWKGLRVRLTDDAFRTATRGQFPAPLNPAGVVVYDTDFDEPRPGYAWAPKGCYALHDEPLAGPYGWDKSELEIVE